MKNSNLVKALKVAALGVLILCAPMASSIAIIAHVVLWVEFRGSQLQRDVLTAGFSLAVCTVLMLISPAYGIGLAAVAAAALWWVFHEPPVTSRKRSKHAAASRKGPKDRANAGTPVIVDAEFWDEETGKWLSQSRQLVKRG